MRITTIAGTPLAAALALASTAALAVPVAQVDLTNSTWDPVTETVVTDSPTFSVYGYGNTGTGGGKTIDTSLDWFLSVAIVPQSPAGTNFGSFTVGGTSYDTTDFVYGTPPLETMLSRQAGDLQQHGIYDTLFTVLDVTWDPAQTRSSVNVQDTQGSDPTANPGTDLMWVGWDFDISGLLAGFNLHFDLFGVSCTSTSARKSITTSGTDCTVKQFAPFSHDGGTSVPEPTALTLLGAGLLLVGGAVRRRRRA